MRSPSLRLRPLALFAALSAACASAPSSAPRARPAAPPPPAPSGFAADSPLFAYATVKVADGVYAFVPPAPRSGVVTGNSVAIVGDDGVVVVDTGRFPSLARKQIEELRRLTPLPVRYVVTTHWHPDHNFGNAAYRDAFPGVVFLAHDETRRLVLEKLPKQVDAQRGIDATVAHLHGLLGDPSAKLSPEDRALVNDTIPALEATRADGATTELVPPTATFAKDATIVVGKREVRVMHLGRGNTAGDAVVYVPDAKVLVTGDLVVRPSPFPEGCYPGEWIETLRKLANLDATTLVPGHGPVQHDFSAVKDEIDLLTGVRSDVAAAVHAGLDRDAVRAKVDLDRFLPRFGGGDPIGERFFHMEFVPTAVGRAYDEARGALPPE